VSLEPVLPWNNLRCTLLDVWYVLVPRQPCMTGCRKLGAAGPEPGEAAGRWCPSGDCITQPYWCGVAQVAAADELTVQLLIVSL